MPGSPTENQVIDTIAGFSNNFGIALNTAVPNPVRDPSSDVAGQCAYIAQPPHFSKFAIGGVSLAIAAIGGGGGKGPSAPTFSDASVIPLGSEGLGGIILSDENLISLEESRTLFTGDQNMFRFDLFEDGGINNLLHVTAYFNVRGDEFKVEDSDAYITFEKGRPMLIIDPNGFFSDVGFEILEKDATNLVLSYEITFAKPMEKSHVILRAWDLDRWASEKVFFDALEIVEGEKEIPPTDESELLSGEPPLQETEISAQEPDSLDKARAKLIESKPIPFWIKTSTGWWSDGSIGDKDFVQGIQYMIQNDIIRIPDLPEYDAETAQEKIPDWIKNIAGWWANDQVSDEEFKQSLQWLIANGVMEI